MDGFFPLLIRAHDEVAQVAWMKYLTCWPLARFLKQEVMPAVPPGLEEAIGSSVHFPLRGGARRHFRNLLATRDTERRPYRVFWSILQGVKRGCHEVPESFIEKTIHKHREALTTKVPELSESETETVRRKFRNLWRPAFKRGPYTGYGTSKVMAERLGRGGNPSDHACVEATRKEGGRASAVRSRLLQHMRDEYGLGEGLHSNSILWRMTEVTPGEVVEERVSAKFLPEVPVSLATTWALEHSYTYYQKNSMYALFVMYIHIYIYIERERSIYTHIYIHTYTYIYIYIYV